MTAAVLIGFAAGYYADRKLGTSPWLLLAGCAFGVASGIWMLARIAEDSGGATADSEKKK